MENFKSDGCSGGLSIAWRFFTGKGPDFESCCYWHDKNYMVGGNSDDRFVADLELFQCVYTISPFWAYIMFFAVRVFGSMDCFWKWNKYDYTI